MTREFSQQPGGPLLDHDRALHVQVELAEVLVRAGRVKRLREGLAKCDGAGLQRFAVEPSRGVRCIVLIRPGNAAANRNGDLRQVERKILDLDGKGFCGCLTSIRRAWLPEPLRCRPRPSWPVRRGGRLPGSGHPQRAEPDDPGVPRIVQLAETYDKLILLFTLVCNDHATDVTTCDVGVDLVGAEVDVDGMAAVDRSPAAACRRR